MSDTPTRRQLVLAALLSGVLLGLSQPLVLGFVSDRPLDPTGKSGLLALICYVPVLVVTRSVRVRSTYWTAFLALAIGHTLHLYWIALAMVVFGGIPVPISAAAVLLLTLSFGFWIGAAFGVTRLLVRRFAWPMWAVFPACLTAADYLRNFGPMGGFSWATSGNAFATVPLLLQGASLVGVYGLVFLLGLTNAVLAEVWVARKRGEGLPKNALLVGGGVLLVWLAWGGFRLGTEPDLPTVRVGLLQGNVDQKKKNRSSAYRREIEADYHRLQAEAVEEGADIVVWPEAALPGGVRTKWSTMRTSGMLPRRGPHAKPPPAAIVGAVAYERKENAKGRGRAAYRSYNTALVTAGDDLKVLGRFDKARLVPFGEYVPWPIDVAIRQIVPGGLTTPGADYAPVVVPLGGRDVPVGATICYEGTFPEITREFANDGAQLMFNVTNDAWYGVSSAATQHLLMYAVRAAETGRAVGRAANTGITAWIDTRGRVHDATRIYTQGKVVADVPLNDETTPYMALGDWVALPATVFALLAWCYALVGAGFRRRERETPEWVAGVAGGALVLGAVVTYVATYGGARDEANQNIAVYAVISGLLVGVGALSGRRWGRTAQMWVGGIAVVTCGLGVVFGSVQALPFAIAGAVVAGVAKKRKHAYVRDADPELHPELQAAREDEEA